ncbi:hypothetical protein [Tenacibaculum maritimum]|nr:hypothetical protein [Tenacibaculum maritimum]
MFAATAAILVSRAVTERIKLVPFMIFVLVYTRIMYLIVVSWK